MARKSKPTAKPEALRYPCLTFSQGKTQLFMFSAPGKELWDVVEINQREEDKDKGYQRAASDSRVKKIATYIDAGNALPTSILISLEADTKIEESSVALPNNADGSPAKRSDLTIVIPKRPNAGWVIDGQHRLSGAHKATTAIALPVVAFIGMPEEGQIYQFITINREQVGVPSSLYYDLLKKLPIKNEGDILKERAAEIASRLKLDEHSPFHGKIVVTSAPTRGEVSMTNFVRKLLPLIKRGSGILDAYTDMEKVGIINNYYRGFERVFGKEYDRDDSIFFQTLGFGALFNALPTILGIVIARTGGGFTVKDVADVLTHIDYFDFAEWHKRGSGSSAEIQAGDDLKQALRNALEGTNKSGGTIRLGNDE